MSEPYGVLNASEWSVRCRACPWRGRPRSVDHRTFGAVRRVAEAQWRAHRCTQGTGAAANRLAEAGPPPLSTREVA
jgi:hypothetical protein